MGQGFDPLDFVIPKDSYNSLCKLAGEGADVGKHVLFGQVLFAQYSSFTYGGKSKRLRMSCAIFRYACQADCCSTGNAMTSSVVGACIMAIIFFALPLDEGKQLGRICGGHMGCPISCA